MELFYSCVIHAVMGLTNIVHLHIQRKQMTILMIRILPKIKNGIKQGEVENDIHPKSLSNF